ncbi:MAG: molybdopterin-guanine dinucleotide biosynthesis protein B [Planctomycetota bacterium]|jgi:molybdopterin-guanine dinucleotide biosynthesis protein MobB
MNPPSSPPVVSLVGRSGAGKTTFLTGLIPALRARGYAVGTMKHHSHRGGVDNPGKDTHRHFEAGADRVALSGPGQTAFFQREEEEPDPREVLGRFFEGTDIVIAEGYKRGPFPKIEVARRQRGESLIAGPEDGLVAVVADFDPGMDVPCFSLDDIEGVVGFLEEKIMAKWQAPGWTAEVTVDGKKISLNEFVNDFVLGTVMGMIGSLKDVPEEPGEVVVKVKKA